jgi:hypothetical protein
MSGLYPLGARQGTSKRSKDFVPLRGNLGQRRRVGAIVLVTVAMTMAASIAFSMVIGNRAPFLYASPIVTVCITAALILLTT